MRSLFLSTTALCSMTIVMFLSAVSSHAGELTLAVANSTCNAVKKVGELYSKNNDVDINCICKSSGRLAKGLQGGTITADIYISANRSWMDYMLEAGMVSSESVTSPWGNALVVATRNDSTLEINDWSELASDKVKTILIGDPGTAPFGRYAKQALKSTGIWGKVRQKIETKKHITLLADSLAESGDKTVGILFVSNVGKDLRTLYTVDKLWHPPIRYYMAPIGSAENTVHVSGMIKFMQGREAQEVFRTAGFVVSAP